MTACSEHSSGRRECNGKSKMLPQTWIDNYIFDKKVNTKDNTKVEMD